jgi:DeoR/GlpR family transcriptional regulator of sugar metabolism
MIEQSECCIVAADKTKFGKSAFAKISDIGVADYLITNSDLDRNTLSDIKKLGIEIW